ncbi:MAG: nicotinamide mononucleotide transporter [Burkholderiaceae bacterium]
MSAIELFAAATGLLGCALLATKGRWSGWGFVAFLLSNIGWLAFSYERAHWAMLAQQIGFSVSSIVGIWCWLVVPAVDRAYEQLTQLEDRHADQA